MLTISIFFVSLVCIIFLFLNKRKGLATGKPYFGLVFGSDFHLRRKIEIARASVKQMPKRAAKATAFFAVKHGLNAYEKVKGVIRPKIAHIIDAIKGRDIPTNKGSVSLYLKSIEEHRNGLK